MVANGSRDEFQQEIVNLTDISKPYVPKICFEKPTRVSQTMQLASGPWSPQISDETSIEAEAERVAPMSRAGPHAAAESAELQNKDDVKILGVFQQGGSSGSGSSSARATDLPSASVQQPSVAQASEPFQLAGLNIARFLAGMDAFEEMPLDILEQKLEQGKMVSGWLGEFGKAFNLNGKPVRQTSTSQRPSSIEPEIFNSFTPI